MTVVFATDAMSTSNFLKLTPEPSARPEPPSSTAVKLATSTAGSDVSNSSTINAPTAANGLSRIDIQAFMGDHTCNDSEMVKRCLVGSWAALMNVGRKGDAETLRKMGDKIFGEATFKKAIEEALFMQH